MPIRLEITSSFILKQRHSNVTTFLKRLFPSSDCLSFYLTQLWTENNIGNFFCGQFHQYYLILRWFPCPKNNQTKTLAQKSCSFDFRSKKLLKNSWWNWHLEYFLLELFLNDWLEEVIENFQRFRFRICLNSHSLFDSFLILSEEYHPFPPE
jgi:hypothetical protein